MVNCKTAPTNLTCSRIYIGRPSVYGNPIRLSAGEPRGATLERYEVYLRSQCKHGGTLKNAILKLAERVARGENIELECFCAPLGCHGDLLRKAILGYAQV